MGESAGREGGREAVCPEVVGCSASLFGGCCQATRKKSRQELGTFRLEASVIPPDHQKPPYVSQLTSQ